MATIKTIPAHIKEHTDKWVYNAHIKDENLFCACFHCKSYMMGHELIKVTSVVETVSCPKCGVDAIIPVESTETGLNPNAELLNEISLFMYPVS